MKSLKNKSAMVVAVVGILVFVVAMMVVKINSETGGIRIVNFEQLTSSLPSSNLRGVEEGILTKLKMSEWGTARKR